jgi:hypothetical protein
VTQSEADLARTRTAPKPIEELPKERKHMALIEITVEQGTDVLTSSRARGTYDSQIREFVEANMAAAQVDLEDGIFKGKKPQTVKTGFESAKERWLKLADAPAELKTVEVRSKASQVYLVRTDLL